MVKRTGPTNECLKKLIGDLRRESYKQSAVIWKAVAEDLERPTRLRSVVNVRKIDRCTKENETVVVPGKVLGEGELSHKLTVAAFAFSKSAKEIIEKANGKCLTIDELIKQNPKGDKIRLMG